MPSGAFLVLFVQHRWFENYRGDWVCVKNDGIKNDLNRLDFEPRYESASILFTTY